MNWNISEPKFFSINKYIKELGVSPTMAQILINRGMDVNTAFVLLNTPIDLVNNNEEIYGAKDAADTIVKHIIAKSDIHIFADYDVDGITSGFVMADFLRKCNCDATVYYPNRNEGYGLNMEYCGKIVANASLDKETLLITVDNGVSALNEIKYLQDSGIEVVVTDHHQPQAVLPNCVICNPCIDKNRMHLSGVAVAWNVCRLIEKILTSNNPKIINDYLYAVAIGTIADVMPLTHENIALVNLGLNQINDPKQSGRMEGLKALIEKLGVKSVTATTIGWDIGPRLNACGRIDDVNKAASLFYMNNNNSTPDEMIDMVLEIDAINNKRKAITKQAAKDIEKLADSDTDFIKIVDASAYPSGIAGIIAGKTVERFGKPAFVHHGGDVISCSARSIPAIDLQHHLAIAQAEGNILGFGGHSQACGVSLLTDKLEDFKNGMNKSISDCIVYTEIGEEVEEDMLQIDCEITLKDINSKTLNEVNSFPYDRNHFRSPLFAVKDLLVVSHKTSKANEENIQFTLKDINNNMLQVWAWGFGSAYKAMGSPSDIDIAGSMEIDFMYKSKITLKIVDIKESVAA